MSYAVYLNKVTALAAQVLPALQQNRLTSIFLATVPVLSGALSYLKTPTIYVVAFAGALTALALTVSFVANKYLVKAEEKKAEEVAAPASVAADASATASAVAKTATVKKGWFGGLFGGNTEATAAVAVEAPKGEVKSA